MTSSRPITRQSFHFPTSFLDNEDVAARNQRLATQLHLLSDPLLAASLQYQTQVGNMTVRGAAHSKHSGGHILLTLLVRRAFGLFRLPFHEDRAFAGKLGPAAQEEFRTMAPELTAPRIETMAREIAELYRHTQRRLADAGLTHVLLQRRLEPPRRDEYLYQQNEPHTIYGLVRASQRLGESHIELEMDTLNSFGDDGGYGIRPITLTLDVPSADVLYCANLVGKRSGTAMEPADLEKGEWMIINRAIDGVVRVPISAIEIREDELVDLGRFDDTDRCVDFLRQYSPAYLRSSTPRDSSAHMGSCYTEKASLRRLRSFKSLLRGVTRR
jgi:hypothetical protein